jgi:hypothetical protein
VGECLPLKEWLEERRDNCRRIAKTKHGTEREGWLEDMQYFSRAVQVVESLIAACGDDHANVPLRMHIALKIMGAWNSGTAGFDGGVVMTINHWIDGGMKGPVPWPDSPFFAAWATGAGFAKVGDYVGFSFQAEMTEAIPVNNPDTTFITPEGTELRRTPIISEKRGEYPEVDFLKKELARYSNPWTIEIWSHEGRGNWTQFCYDAPIPLAEAEARTEVFKAENPAAKFRVVPWLNSSQRQHVIKGTELRREAAPVGMTEEQLKKIEGSYYYAPIVDVLIAEIRRLQAEAARHG